MANFENEVDAHVNKSRTNKQSHVESE